MFIMPKKYSFDYLIPSLEEYNNYPALIKKWKDNVDIEKMKKDALEKEKKKNS